MVRPLAVADSPAILTFIASMDMFEENEIDEIRKRLDEHIYNDEHAIWYIHGKDEVEGVAYCIPEPMTSGTWNLLMLLVGRDRQRKGVGKSLVEAVEQAVVTRAGRLLIVETSSGDDYAGAKRFYAKCGFEQVARIPDFYAFACDKIVFSKHLHSGQPAH